MLTIIAGCVLKKPHPNTFRVFSAQINDSFFIEVYENISDSTTPINSIYVLDAEIDNRTQRLHDTLIKRNPNVNYRIIGIGQSHYSKTLRKRDFVPPADGSFLSKQALHYGNADNFYKFIKDSIAHQYDANSASRTLIGHSYGGLFGVYISTLDSCFFDTVYALSPSLWINRSNFIHLYHSKYSPCIKTNLNIIYGSLERHNKVRPAIQHFQSVLKPDDTSLTSFKKLKNKTHKSILQSMFTINF